MQSQILDVLNHRDVRVSELTAVSSFIIYWSITSGFSSQFSSWVEFGISPTFTSYHGLQPSIPYPLSANLTYAHPAAPLLCLEPRMIAYNQNSLEK